MLDELILSMTHGSSYGSGALKALQNDNLPEIDLLVREAIQNSSDASIGIDEDYFAVSFNVNSFSTRELNEIMPSLKDILNEKYPSEKEDFLEIRDSKTSGLTGPVKLSELDPEDHGNYWKLVFDTGKEQTSSNAGEAGGSWGYGKSVYYRAGIGLVIFYSQIRNDSGNYEERLIISLTERENDNNSLLKRIKPDSVGRAWWGQKDINNKDEFLPITDPSIIRSILDIFHLNRFNSEQTGTSIIIPYIDKKRLLDGIFPDDCGISEEEKEMCPWKDNVIDYLKLAIEKWYAPKVFNKKITEISGQKWLAARVNGEALKTDSMRGFFLLVQELYTTGLFKNAGKEYKSEVFKDICSISIPSQRIEGQKSGFVSYVKIKQNQLSQTGSMIKPYVYLRLFGKSALNDPIVMFARTPGMILDYKIFGKWAKGIIKPENEDEYLVVFYLPNCEAKLKNEPSLGTFAGTAYGEYLRGCEKSDHMDWEDKSNYRIIDNVKNQIAQKINESIKKEDETPIEGTVSRLSRKLGSKLLPLLSNGNGGGGGGGSSGGSGGTSLDNAVLEFAPSLVQSDMVIKFRVSFKNSRKRISLGIFVETETGVIDVNGWEKDIGEDFPIKLVSISDASIETEDTGLTLSFKEECTPENERIKNYYSTIELIKSDSGSIIRGFTIDNEITHAVVSGSLRLSTSNRKCVCTIKEI